MAPSSCTLEQAMAGVRSLTELVKRWKSDPLARMACLIWSPMRTPQQLKRTKRYISLMGKSTKRLAAMTCWLRDAALARQGPDVKTGCDVESRCPGTNPTQGHARSLRTASQPTANCHPPRRHALGA